MFQDYYADRTPEAIAKEFGPQFAVAVEKLRSGSWQGPVESGYGWHLVFVDTVIPGRIPAFEEMEPDVKTAWLSEQKQQAWGKAYKEMRAKYTVLLPAPPDTGAPQAPTPPPAKQVPAPSGEAPLRPASCPLHLARGLFAACRFRRFGPRGPSRLPRNERNRARNQFTSSGEPLSWQECVCRCAQASRRCEEFARTRRTGIRGLLGRTPLDRRWPNGLAGKRIEFPGLPLTITDVLVRVELLDGRKWTTIVHPSQPWVEIARLPADLDGSGWHVRGAGRSGTSSSAPITCSSCSGSC